MSRNSEKSLKAHLRRARRREKLRQWGHWVDENLGTLTLALAAVGLLAVVYTVRYLIENDQFIREMSAAAEKAAPILQYYGRAIPLQSKQIKETIERDIAEYLARANKR